MRLPTATASSRAAKRALSVEARRRWDRGPPASPPAVEPRVNNATVSTEVWNGCRQRSSKSFGHRSLLCFHSCRIRIREY